MHIPPPQPKYEIEDNLDFFAVLKSIPSNALEPEPDDSHENVCLITNEPLNAFNVTLACGHKFNYEPLYQEVLRQKGRLGVHNYYEKIGIHQMKCPYCRTITNELLPYIGVHPIIKRLNGVNAPAHMCMSGVACHHNSCDVNAFYEHDSKPHCLRHYNAAIKAASKSKSKAIPVKDLDKCAAEIQTGKNKGKQCGLNASQTDPPLCKKHSKCNVVLYA